MISRAAVMAVLMSVGLCNEPDTRAAYRPGRPQRRQATGGRHGACICSNHGDTDHKAFMSFLSQEAVFFSGEKPLRGAQHVGELVEALLRGPDGAYGRDRVEVLNFGLSPERAGPGPRSNASTNHPRVVRLEAAFRRRRRQPLAIEMT